MVPVARQSACILYMPIHKHTHTKNAPRTRCHAALRHFHSRSRPHGGERLRSVIRLSQAAGRRCVALFLFFSFFNISYFISRTIPSTHERRETRDESPCDCGLRPGASTRPLLWRWFIRNPSVGAGCPHPFPSISSCYRVAQPLTIV
jgi:hypothetical protein